MTNFEKVGILGIFQLFIIRKQLGMHLNRESRVGNGVCCYCGIAQSMIFAKNPHLTFTYLDGFYGLPQRTSASSHTFNKFKVKM